MNTAVIEPLQRLKDALAGERQALLDHDIERLIRATQDKLEALRSLEADMPHGEERVLRELAEVNRANGALLSRRRREVNWALRHLGRTESAATYDARGQSNLLHSSKPLAIA
jgi:flagellar biosynthesis/type III secretory pathway chaperone